MRARLRRWLARATAVGLGRRLDVDFQREIDAHLEMLIEDNIRRGMTRQDAERAAHVRFGGSESLKTRHREVRGLPGLESLWQDLRFAVRLTIKQRWFSAAAVAALAIGIGANATGFSIINAAFLRGLPFDNASALCEVWWRTSGGRSSVSYADLVAWRTMTRTVDLAAFDEGSLNISDDVALPEQVRGAWITANLFGVLRQRVFRGRDLASGEDAPGVAPVVIIGHRLWQTRYGSDAAVLGKTIKINGQQATIVGVMPEGMRFPEVAEIWAPLVPASTEIDQGVTAIARVRDDVDRREAEAELSTVALRLAGDSERARSYRGVLMKTYGIGGYATTVFPTIMVAAGLVLVIACANVANLLLSRSAFRAREMAMRIALGATPGRVLRQLLMESLVLAAIGGAVGLWLAVIGVTAFERAMSVSEKPYWMVFTIDASVLLYVSFVIVVTTVLFGLAPALHVSSVNAHETLRDSGRSASMGQQLRTFSSAMIVLQLAITFILLAGAGLLARSFTTLYTIDLGVETTPLITMRIDLDGEQYQTSDSRWRFLERIKSRVASLPAVEAVAFTTGVPSLDGGERLLEVDGGRGADQPQFVSTVDITPEFFHVVNRHLLRGRGFDQSDGSPGAEAVIINERLANQFFRGEDPIGRQLRFRQRTPDPGQPTDRWRTIVGVSPSIRHGSPVDAYMNAVVYVPYRQTVPPRAWLLLRTSVAPDSIMEAVRREVRAEDPDQPVYGLRTVDQLLERDRWPYRVFGGLFSILAIASLVLAAVGLYAVMAYAVSCRTHEIGVRVAVGANRGVISWLILKRACSHLVIGLPIGIAGAVALGIVLQRLLVDMSPFDPTTLTAVAGVLTSVALLACIVPAYRALRVDPVLALRSD
jgi:predicted permease